MNTCLICNEFPIYKYGDISIFVKELIKTEKFDLIETIYFKGVSTFWTKLNIIVIIRLHGYMIYFVKMMKIRISRLTNSIIKQILYVQLVTIQKIKQMKFKELNE